MSNIEEIISKHLKDVDYTYPDIRHDAFKKLGSFLPFNYVMFTTLFTICSKITVWKCIA